MSPFLYRFLSNNKGIYEAVEECCPRDDGRRNLKPDGSWLPRVGEKYPGAISFWKPYGLEKYLSSGLQEWHRSVLVDPLDVVLCDSLENIVYEDDFQVIGHRPSNPRQMSWDIFIQAACTNHGPKPTISDSCFSALPRHTLHRIGRIK